MNRQVSRIFDLVHATEKLEHVFKNSADVLPDERRTGNRDWRIDVELSSLRLPPRPAVKPLSGFVARHTLGSFTAYAVNIGGDEVWFDQMDPALDLLANSLKR